MKDIDNDNLKMMYDRVYDELNRGRDWPIKIMAFASAAYFGLFSLVKIDPNSTGLSDNVKIMITIFLVILLAWTIKIIITQHINYLKYRDIQIKLQKAMGVYDWKVDSEEIFPKKWKEPIVISMWSGFFGWGFYACYLSIIAFITLTLVWGL